MNLIRCSQGHFYDADSFPSCPHCGMSGSGGGAGDATVSTSSLQERLNRSQTAPARQQEPADLDATVSIFSQRSRGGAAEASGQQGAVSGTAAAVRPVVGWLVCVDGPDYGRDYRLVAGHNFIGRGKDMNVNIENDTGISRTKHAILTYDPMQNGFFIQPGESHELCYLNGKVVLEHMLLSANDVLALGNSKLLFIPCCTTAFQWEMLNKRGNGND